MSLETTLKPPEEISQIPTTNMQNSMDETIEYNLKSKLMN